MHHMSLSSIGYSGDINFFLASYGPWWVNSHYIQPTKEGKFPQELKHMYKSGSVSMFGSRELPAALEVVENKLAGQQE